MASNKKSYDGAHDYKQELKSGYRHSERSETDTCPTKLKLMKCKNVKGKDGFTLGKIYDVLYAGRVYWVENDYGERICDSDESFEPV